MADDNTTSWRALRSQLPMNEQRVAMNERLIEIESQLAEICRKRGLSQPTLAATMEASQPTVSGSGEQGDVSLSTLARYLEALGGFLEVRAVFPEETVTLLRDVERD